MDSSLIEGYVSPATYQRAEGIELLRRSAQVAVVPYLEVRALYFVKEFLGMGELDQKRVFGSRPKQDGLWVRLKFRDEEVYEGVVPNNLLLMGEHGLTFTPPDASSNTQRIFVPRQALAEVQVLGVIGSPMNRRRPRRREPVKEQIGLFREDGSTRVSS